MRIAPEDHARVGAAIRAAEAKTSGEIVCVLARSSGDHATTPLAWSILLALLTPWALLLTTRWPVARLLLAQLGVFAVALLALSAPGAQRALTPRRILRARAHRAAAEQFLARGLARSRQNGGVLIFVSLAERYARILVDERALAAVADGEWRAAVDALTAHMRAGAIADGFVVAIEHCGDILARHLPPEPGRTNELPDRLFVI